MKKFVLLGALAVAVAALAQEEASAWTNCKFGIGLNWEHSSGGNNLLWGVFRNGQVPPPPVPFDGHGFYPAPGGYPVMPGHAETQPAPGTSVPTSVQPNSQSAIGYPGYQMVSFPPYYPYYVPVNYGH
jgi:hypothetical protein